MAAVPAPLPADVGPEPIVVEDTADSANRRGPFRPERLAPVRERLSGPMLARLFRSLDVVVVVGAAMAAAVLRSPNGLLDQPFGAMLPLMTAPVALLWAVRILEFSPLRWMGRRSYGAYLWHYAAMALAGLVIGVKGPLEAAGQHDQFRALPLFFGFTWALAALSYGLVFKPAQALKPLVTPDGASAPVSPAGGEGTAPARYAPG